MTTITGNLKPTRRRWNGRRVTASLMVVALAVGLLPVTAGPAAAMPALTLVGRNGAPCAYATVGAALAAANSGDTVYLAPATYNETLGVVDVDLHLTAATTDCTAADPVASPYSHVINGGGALAGNGGLLHIAAGRTVTLTNLMLEDAMAGNGGLVYVATGATAAFQRVRLNEGAAGDRGGLVFVAAGATLTINGSSYLQNGSAATAGGALYVEGQATLIGTQVHSSQAPLGGGAAVAGNGQLTLYYSHLGNGPYPNSAGEGGGAHLSGQAQLELHQGSLILWNSATAGDGGGVHANGAVAVTLYGSSRIYGNEATAYGGGVYAANGATVTLHDTSQIGDPDPVRGNSAVRGGGLYADGAAGVTLNDQAMVLHNSAGDGGGGLYLDGSTPLLMHGGVISGNTTTGWGGGLALAEGQADLWGAVIVGNTAQEGGGVAVDNQPENAVTMTNTQVISNVANLDGGGIHTQAAEVTMLALAGTARLAGNEAGQNGGGAFSTGNDQIGFGAVGADSWMEIADNTAGGSGGGLYVENQSDAFLLGNTGLTGNTALGSGGGWYQTGGRAFAIGVTAGSGPRIVGNTAYNGHGGGLYLADVSSAPDDIGTIFLNILVSGNQADLDGGGLYVTSGSFVRLANSQVLGNQAGQDGGGVLVSAARLEMGYEPTYCHNAQQAPNRYCSELRDNAATINGGALALELAAELTLSHTAIISNSAALGSGVMSSSNADHLEITNSLFTDNTGKTLYLANDAFLDLVQTTFAANDWAIDINDNGATANLANNIVWGNGFGVESAVALAADCSIAQNGVGGMITDPLFHTTGRGDYRLGSGSKAIDACDVGTLNDLDGGLRPQGDDYDMGAFETGRPIVLFSALITGAEGHAGLTPLPFTLALSEVSTQTVSVHLQTVGDSATADSDFQAISQTVTFLPGVLTQTVMVNLVGELVYEEDEALSLVLTQSVGALLPATTAEALIVNDDALPSLTAAPVAALEGDSGTTPITLVVSLSHASAFTVTVDYATDDDDDDGSATEGEDYVATSGTLTFAPGATAAEVAVYIQGDTVEEGDEQFWVRLSSAAGATLAPSDDAPTITVEDDDGGWTIYLPLITR